jgi:hypothetical protein
MARYGGTKEEMLAQRAALEFSLANAISSAENAANRLTFESALAEVNHRVGALGKAAEEVARSRARGYIWAADLEQKLQQAQAMATKSVDTARAESQRASRELKGRADQALQRAQRLRGRPAHTVENEINALSSEASGLSSAIDAAERKIAEAVKGFTETVDGLTQRLAAVHFTLDCFEKTAFKLQPEENAVLAVKATWEDSPQGKKEGVLLFTAHRLRFEHLEEVVLERSFIFFASRTDTKRTPMLDVLIGQLVASDHSARGLLFKDELLTLTFRPSQGVPAKTTFEIDGSAAKDIDTVIEQLRSGDMARARYQGPMPEGSNVGVPVRWPERCENCGAALTPPVRGQNLITCDYCRAQHPVELGQA